MQKSLSINRTSDISTKEREMFDIIFRLGHSYWKQFCETPRGIVVRLFFSSEAAWCWAETLFMHGFGDRMIESICFSSDRLTDLECAENFENSWAEHLSLSEDEILRGGPVYLNTPDKILQIAKCFYRVGYLRADILIED